MASKSRSWGHIVRPLTPEEIQNQIECGKSSFRFWSKYGHPETVKDESTFVEAERKCRISRKCKNPSVYMLSYYYITGKRGNVSFAEKPICEDCAKKYITAER